MDRSPCSAEVEEHRNLTGNSMESRRKRYSRIEVDGFGSRTLADWGTCKTNGISPFPAFLGPFPARWLRRPQDTYGSLRRKPGFFTCSKHACCNRSLGRCWGVRTLPEP